MFYTYSYTYLPCQDFNSSDLSTILPTWKGHTYEALIPDDVCREILDEIFRVSFKHELLLLDRYLYVVKPRDSIPEEGEIVTDVDASTREERNIKLIDALRLDTDVLGFAASDPDTRRHSYLGLYHVMNGWSVYRNSGMSDGTHEEAQKLFGTLTSEELRPIAYRLAYHYIHSYAKFFKQPPTLPYCL